MLTKRIIPCLDVKDNKVVKGVRFHNHEVVGDIIELAQFYEKEGADELVFYDITASGERRTAKPEWVTEVAKYLRIPFCVAGGIRSVKDAEIMLNSGADKISINTPALDNPQLITDLASRFGQQCVVIGIDSLRVEEEWIVCQYTGDQSKTKKLPRTTISWVREVQQRGAGEIVLNCMNQDGVKEGYDLKQLSLVRAITKVPLIASGGAGKMQHFSDVFSKCIVDGALAASVFHSGSIRIPELKKYLSTSCEVRL